MILINVCWKLSKRRLGYCICVCWVAYITLKLLILERKCKWKWKWKAFIEGQYWLYLSLSLSLSLCLSKMMKTDKDERGIIKQCGKGTGSKTDWITSFAFDKAKKKKRRGGRHVSYAAKICLRLMEKKWRKTCPHLKALHTSTKKNSNKAHSTLLS